MGRGKERECLQGCGRIAGPRYRAHLLAVAATGAQTETVFLHRYTKLVGKDDDTNWSLVKFICAAKGSRH